VKKGSTGGKHGKSEINKGKKKKRVPEGVGGISGPLRPKKLQKDLLGKDWEPFKAIP